MFICSLCSRTFDEVALADAIPLPTLGRRQLYRFKNGLVHELKPYNGPAVPIGAVVRNPGPFEDKND